MCLKCVQWKHARQMVPLPSMFLTCSYLFPGAFAPSENSIAEPSSRNSSTEPSSQNSSTEPSSQNSFTEASAQTPSSKASSQNQSTKASPPQKSKSQPSKPRKKKPQPLTSTGSLPRQPPIPASQAAVTPDVLHSTPNPMSDLPIDPPTNTSNTGGDIASFSTTTNPHQPLSQATVVPGELTTVDPSQLVTEPSQPIVEPSQVTPEPPQSISKHSEILTDVPMDTRPDSAAALLPPQPLINATLDSPVPGVPYRVRNTTTVASEGRSRRNSIDGAPEMVVDVIEEEISVDLSEFINLDSDDDNNNNNSNNNKDDDDDDEDDSDDNDDDGSDDNDDNDDNDDRSHISSSQKTADGCQDIPPPPPVSQQQHTHVGTKGGNTSLPKVVSGRTCPKFKVNDEDFPVWMTKKGQWKYLTSTAGGTAWENLLKAYINQERRLEFTEMVSNPTCIFHTHDPKLLKGSTLTNEGRPLKIKEYFQYAHQPSRGDTLVVPDFGAEVTEWWEKIQPEWRRSKRDPPQDPNRWSYILSGGSKGAFLVILCLAWWDRSYERHIGEQKRARQVEAEAGGVTATFDDLPDHDAGWLNIVNDVAFVMQKARDCAIPARGAPSPSRGGKRKREEDPVISQEAPAVKRTSRKRSKV